jgi:malate dehydrogenase
VVLGKSGIERIVDLALTPEEKGALEKSAASVRKVVDVVKAAAQ